MFRYIFMVFIFSFFSFANIPSTYDAFDRLVTTTDERGHVSNVDPTRYYSMADASMAMGIQNTLQNIQIETYMNIGDMMTNPQGAGDLSGIPAIAGTTIGLKLLMRLTGSHPSSVLVPYLRYKKIKSK
jgi:hypothetical protein